VGGLRLLWQLVVRGHTGVCALVHTGPIGQPDLDSWTAARLYHPPEQLPEQPA